MTVKLRYEINDPIAGFPVREVDVHASADELAEMDTQGFLVKERLFTGDDLERLREATDRLEAREGGIAHATSSDKFGGFFARYIHDKDGAFLDLVQRPELVSIVRAMLGPAIKLSGSTLRVTYPGEPGQETIWHTHRRVIPEPLPPWFSQPHVIDILIYLDDLARPTGPLVVVPESHRWYHRKLDAHDYGDKEGQRVLALPAGSAVFMHSNVWHRGMPTMPEGQKRRLVLLGYAPAWFVDNPYGQPPDHPLSDRYRDGDDAELRELFGNGGYV